MADGEAQRRAGTTAAPVILSQRHLNRALLARQLLLERSPLPLPVALEQVGGLQTQYAPSGYVGLWIRLAGFRRHDLTRALEAREVVQATLMRATIHLVSAREFWHYAEGIRESRRAWLERVDRSMDPAAWTRPARESARPWPAAPEMPGSWVTWAPASWAGWVSG